MNNSDEKQIYLHLKNFEKDSISKSDEDIFREVNKFDVKFSGNKLYIFNINGIIINIGSKKKSLKLLYFAIGRLKKLLKKKSSDKLLFDLGNAFLSIAETKLGHRPKIEDLVKNKEHREARKYFNQISDFNIFPSAATNSGNILEKYARNYEAIFMYDEALKINPNFGMALGNKGIALTYYFNLISKKNPEIILESRELLKKSLEVENTLEIGGKIAIDNFKKRLDSVEKFIKRINIKKEVISKEFGPSSNYLSFCKEKNLFLNFCFNCYRCEKGFYDDFFPPFISSIKDATSNESIKYRSFPKKIYYSIKILNQMIEDYSTARNIYYRAIYENFKKLDKVSTFRSTLDYCRNCLKYGFIKTAYIKLFNIFDKIAHLIFNYYEIDDKNVYFHKLVSPKYENLLISKKNHSLLALHNIAWDFKKDGLYYHLNQIRNFLTHDFIDIKEDFFNYDKTDDELYNQHHLTEQLLCEYTDKLFILVKAGITYFINALYYESFKIKKELRHEIPNLTVVTQKFIFEDSLD
jgi:hypothetical protein